MKLRDVLQLEAELNGFSDPDGKELFRGMLQQNIGVVTKFHLNKLLLRVTDETKAYRSMYSELLGKYGKLTGEGGYELDGESREKFVDDLKQLQDQDVNIGSENMTISIKDFAGLQTEFNYPVLFSIIGE